MKIPNVSDGVYWLYKLAKDNPRRIKMLEELRNKVNQEELIHV